MIYFDGTPTVSLRKHLHHPSMTRILLLSLKFRAISWDFGTVLHRRAADAQARLCRRTVSSEPVRSVYTKNVLSRRLSPNTKAVAPPDSCWCAFEDGVYPY